MVERKAIVRAAQVIALAIAAYWLLNSTWFIRWRLCRALGRGEPDYIRSLSSAQLDAALAHTCPMSKLSPLHLAVIKMKLPIVRELLLAMSDSVAARHINRQESHPAPAQRGAPAEEREELCFNSLAWAVGNGQLELLQLLLERGGDPRLKFGAHKDSLLHLATGERACDKSRELIAALANDATRIKLNERNQDGHTPVHAAARSGCVPALEALLAQGAKLDSVDHFGMTALHHAADSGRAAAVEWLLAHGLDAQAVENDQWTALHWASASGHADVVALLLDAGAACDVVDREGWSPLHAAARFGHQAVVETLLARCTRVDLEAQDKFGVTPVDAAARNNHAEVARVLRVAIQKRSAAA